MDHFEQETCLACDQNLLRIGGNLYVLHGSITCIEVPKVKQEPEFDIEDSFTGICHEESENIEIENDDKDTEQSDNLLVEANIKVESIDQINNEVVSDQKNALTDQIIQSKALEQLYALEVKKPKRGRPAKCREKSNEIGNKNAIIDHDDDGSNVPAVYTTKRGRQIKKDTFFQYDFKGCGKIVKNRCRAKHLNTHKKERFECDICHITLASKMGIRAHFDVHYPKREFKCHICAAEYKSLSSLNQHIRYIHNNEPKQFICTICGSAQRKKHLLWEHMNRHQGIKPYRCTFDGCEMQFFSKARRTEHMRTHTREKPYQCDVERCSNRFAYTVDLKRHKFKAHGIYTKQHKCSICTEIFPENRILKKHMATHHKQIVH